MKKYLYRLVYIFIIEIIIILILPLAKPLFKEDYSLVIKGEKGKILRVFLNSNDQWCFPPEDTLKIPDKLKKAVICFEDNYFYWHQGINPFSIIRAISQNFKNNRVVSGASTITMQVARMMEPKKRTYFNKILEAFNASKIELYNSKDEILRLYLDHTPYGGNIIGYRAASGRYFRKTPQELSWSEAALLAVLPNSPRRISPLINNNLLKEKRNRLLLKLLDKKIIKKETYHLAIIEPIPVREYPFEIVSPHLTQRIFSTFTQKKVINTTIDYKIQKHLESLVKFQMGALRQQGIRNCAVLIIETITGKVKAYSGSHDFFDFENQGQVDGVIAPRSSGSLLKPFLYALSIDEGIILPQTLLKDVPTYFDAFSPSNADEKFNGIVPAKEALTRSLNVPAVRLLNTFGLSRFYSFLKNAGVSTLYRQAEDYGLPIIIGGAEANLWDMAMIYRGLGNNGEFHSNYYISDDSVKAKDTNLRLISPGACFLTLEILKELKRPGAEFYWQQYQNQRPIAWKTGTSYGHKDAWAVGVSPQWTVAVWVGNFDGQTNLNLSGTASAGPILFSIFNFLPKSQGLHWFEKKNKDFKVAQICKETGFLAGQYCDNTQYTEVPVFMLPLRVCPFHRNLYVDKDEQHIVCSYCWKKGYHEKHYLIFPVEVNFQLRQRGQLIVNIPEHSPGCQKKTDVAPIQFVYPLDSARLIIPRDFGGSQQRVVAKIAHNQPSKNVFWYLDDEYLGNTRRIHTKAMEIRQGWHNLLVIDEDGFKDKISFFARLPKN